MAIEEHLDIIRQGVSAWNEWRKKNPEIKPDLSGAPLLLKNLSGADLSDANLTGANFTGANLINADLSGANLSAATLFKAYLMKADLSGANLSGTYFNWVNLIGANLQKANLVETNFEEAKLTGCRIYGISAWNLKLQNAIQSDLIITPEEEPTITVDNIEFAQFIYLLLNNEKLRDVIETLTSKVVLILGRFTLERKSILDAIRNELRNRNYLPILFDFEKAHSRDMAETIALLAQMSRFIIADITDAKSIPAELALIVPNLPSVPVKPISLSSDYEYGLFDHIKKFPWVLEVFLYNTPEELLKSLEEKVINPTEEKVRELRKCD